VYAVNSKIFYLSILLFLGVVLDLDKYIFPWQMCFLWGDCFSLELACVRVNTVCLTKYSKTSQSFYWF